MGRARSTEGVEPRANSIRVKFTYEGKQRRETLILNGAPLPPTPPNLKYAARLVAEIKEKIRLDMFSWLEYFPANGDTHEETTVGDLLDTWLAAQRLAPSTRKGYASAVAFWKAHPAKPAVPVGERAVRGLKYSHIKTVLAERTDLSGKTINNYVQVLREAMAMAKKDGDLTVNPVVEVEAAKYQKPEVDPFSAEEAKRIAAHIAREHPEQVANMVAFWMWTGLRTSELFGLTWDKVDFARAEVRISEAVVRGQRKDTKTSTARNVRLNSIALAALKAQKLHTFLAGGAVFQDPRYDLDWVDERAFRRSFWTPTLKRLGIRYRRPYNMRHTYATAMLMAGMNHSWCAKQMGHSIEMFQRTYAKWLDGEQNDREMEKLERALAPAGERKTS